MHVILYLIYKAGDLTQNRYRNFHGEKERTHPKWFSESAERVSRKNFISKNRNFFFFCTSCTTLLGELTSCFLNFVLSSIYSASILAYVECWESVNIFLIKDGVSIVSKISGSIFDTFDWNNFFLYTKDTVMSPSPRIILRDYNKDKP